MTNDSGIRKGIILAGGAGSRLYPNTVAVNKQLLPVYDKPMIYYPISTLMLGGLRELLIISGPEQLPAYEKLLGTGERFGVEMSYAVQQAPRGIAEAFLVGERFLDGEGCSLILGDNIFWGKLDFFRHSLQREHGATIFAYRVHDPQRYGVVEFDSTGRALSIEEKPKAPKSEFAIPGLYVYDDQVVGLARKLKPSARGELEITDLNRAYLEQGQLSVLPLGRGMAWLDTGTVESLLDASQFVGAIARRQGLKVGCPEEVALHMGFLSAPELSEIVQTYPTGEYRSYLEGLIERRDPQVSIPPGAL